MEAPYLIKLFSAVDAKAMIAMILESRNVDVLKISKDIATSFKYGKNYGLYFGDKLIGVSGIIDTHSVASLSYLYIQPQYRMKKISLDFTYKIINSIKGDIVHVKARDISTFRSLVVKHGARYHFKKDEFLSKIQSRIFIDPLES